MMACGGHAATRPTPPPADDLDAWADRACACTDRACAEQVDQALTAVAEAVDVARLLDDHERATAAFEAKDRAVHCLWDRRTVAYAFESWADKSLVALADRLCACPDLGCVDAFYRDHGDDLAMLLAVPLHAATRDVLRAQVSPAGACVARLQDAAGGAPDDGAAPDPDGAGATEVAP